MHLRVADMTASLTSLSQQRQQRHQEKERKKKGDRRQRSACFERCVTRPVSSAPSNHRALPLFFLFFFSPRRVISKSPKQPGKRSRRAEQRRLERKEERKVAEEDVGGFGERERWESAGNVKREKERKRMGRERTDKTSNNSITRRGSVTLPGRASKCEQNFVKALLANSRRPLLVSRCLSMSFHS